jgi:hypothetical protein
MGVPNGAVDRAWRDFIRASPDHNDTKRATALRSNELLGATPAEFPPRHLCGFWPRPRPIVLKRSIESDLSICADVLGGPRNLIQKSKKRLDEFLNARDEVVHLRRTRFSFLAMVAEVAYVGEVLDEPPLWRINYVCFLKRFV